jgi:hypothetical protein
MALVLSYFPLFAIDTSSAPPRCACTRPNCSAIGKHPAKKGWRHAESEIGPDGNGVKTGNGLVVVDLDVRPEKGKDGVSELLALLPLGEDIPDAQKIPDTLTVSTPTGGVHLYFEVPKDIIISNSSGLVAPGIDIRSEGGFVVAPGSPHKNGGTYVCEDESAPIAPMPSWLLEKILAVSKKPREASTIKHRTLAGEADASGWNRAVSWAHALCETAEPSVEGLNGSSRLFHVACQLMRSSLPIPKLAEIIAETYNPRCSPSWSPEEIEHKLFDADGVFDEPRGLPPEGLMERICALGTPCALGAPTHKTTPSDRASGRKRGGWSEIRQPVPYLVEDLIPMGSVGILAAQPGAGKTWITTSLALAISEGKPWLGKFTTRKGLTLFVDYEANEDEMVRRLGKLHAGDAPDFMYESPDMALHEPAFWEALAAEDPPPAFVVCDGLSAGTPGVDENTKDMELPLRLAKNIFTRKTGSSVLFIHHLSKAGDLRGFSGIRAACDIIYFCEADDTLDSENGSISTTIGHLTGPLRTKFRQGVTPQPFRVVLTDEDGLSLVESMLPSGSGPPDGWQQTRVLHILREGGPVFRSDLCKKLGGKSEVARKLIKELERDGRIVERNRKLELDDPMSRELRIINAIRGMKGLRISTKRSLQELATVNAYDISALEASGIIYRDKTNGYLVDDRKLVLETNGASRHLEA